MGKDQGCSEIQCPVWESDSTSKFKAALQSPNLQMLIQEYLSDINSAKNVNTSAEQVENILITTAKRCLKIRKTRRHKRTYSRSNLKKKWFDKECRLKRHKLRKLSNEKHRDPLNTTAREKYIVLQHTRSYSHIKEMNITTINFRN